MPAGYHKEEIDGKSIYVDTSLMKGDTLTIDFQPFLWTGRWIIRSEHDYV